MFTKSTAFRSLFAALCALLTVFACAIQTKIAKPAGIDLEPVYGLKTISSFLYRLRDIFTVSLNPPQWRSLAYSFYCSLPSLPKDIFYCKSAV